MAPEPLRQAPHASPQFFFVEPIDVAQDFGGELAARYALGGDLVKQPVLRLGGQIAQQPLAIQAVRCALSKPAFCRAVGQSSRKSTATVRRSVVGAAPRPASVVVLKSITCG